ncbi:hypothetical protein Fmac_015782 [Flemingia macrophylla]|uniref:Pentatricopeptide repeat-containing protein n=1 Tax=Flemingia macrophylla TaxID=520843 RepID=A0ABD1MFI9_9FABA
MDKGGTTCWRLAGWLCKYQSGLKPQESADLLLPLGYFSAGVDLFGLKLNLLSMGKGGWLWSLESVDKLQCLQRYLLQSQASDGFHMNAPTYNAMINGLCKAGLFDKALALLSKMEEKGGMNKGGTTCWRLAGWLCKYQSGLKPQDSADLLLPLGYFSAGVDLFGLKLNLLSMGKGGWLWSLESVDKYAISAKISATISGI